MELQRLGYPNQYVREVQDTYTGKKEKRFGFKTTSITRPTIISRLVEIVRDHCDLICDRETLEELLTIIKNEKGKAEAPEGGHDDMMMALAIAHHIREQVVFDSHPVPVDPVCNFNTEKNQSNSRDYGRKIVVI
jgi:phage terminase large subunit